jgi:hypothetical protein
VLDLPSSSFRFGSRFGWLRLGSRLGLLFPSTFLLHVFRFGFRFGWLRLGFIFPSTFLLSCFRLGSVPSSVSFSLRHSFFMFLGSVLGSVGLGSVSFPPSTFLLHVLGSALGLVGLGSVLGSASFSLCVFVITLELPSSWFRFGSRFGSRLGFMCFFYHARASVFFVL